MLREIVVDTETTGLEPAQGHRIVEIGCVELINHIPSGRTWHRYVNPLRDMPADAFAVHGLSAEFLLDKPLFEEIAGDFTAFLGDDKLVIHNGAFDLMFLNAELTRCNLPLLGTDRLTDTLDIARRRYPNASNSLDALCRRFTVDTSTRLKHGALIDCELLAAVYLELVGGRQPGFALMHQLDSRIVIEIDRPYRAPRPHTPTEAELSAHQLFVRGLENAIWLS